MDTSTAPPPRRDLSPTASELHGLSRRELMQVLRSGHAIDPSALDDTEYRGTSLGLGAALERLTWKKFRKTFHRDPETGHLRGWNVRLVQDGLEAPDTPRTRGGTPVTFGHYRVVSPEGHRLPFPTAGLLIHYGLAGNRRLDPLNRARDPLVAVRKGDPSLLLGWSYFDWGLIVGTPSFFTLELAGPLTRVVAPPRPPS